MATIQDVYNELKNNLLSVRSDVAVNPGSVISDVFLTPTSYVLYRNRVLLDYVKALQSLYTIQILLASNEALAVIANVELKTVDEVKTDIANFINKIGDNYRLTRFSAVEASGTVFFGRIDPPSQSIAIPIGTKIRTADNKQYTTQISATMNIGDPNLYDPESNLYVVEVPVKAVEVGTIGNAVTGSITQFVTQISGLNYVFNKTNFINGFNEETDDQFIERIKNQLSGHNFGTVNGYKNLILNNFRTVKDILVVPAGDALMERDNGMGGVVDIWVLEESPSVVTSELGVSFNTIVGGLNGYIFSNQPVDEIFVMPNTGVRVDDTTSIAHSYAETTSAIFQPPSSGGPVPPFDVSYSYFAIIKEIQEFLQAPQNAILGNTLLKNNAIEDIALVKKAIERKVNISASIIVLSNADPNAVIVQCQDAILNYIINSGLGQSISQSDIVGILENVVGVDSVRLPLDVFNFVEETTPAQVNTLTIALNEYIRVDSIIVAV